MKMIRFFRDRGGQTGQAILEYAVFLSVICFVFLSMMHYMRNSVNAKLRTVQDRVNEAVHD